MRIDQTIELNEIAETPSGMPKCRANDVFLQGNAYRQPAQFSVILDTGNNPAVLTLRINVAAWSVTYKKLPPYVIPQGSENSAKVPVVESILPAVLAALPAISDTV